jgi:hypothetical protein
MNLITEVSEHLTQVDLTSRARTALYEDTM